MGLQVRSGCKKVLRCCCAMLLCGCTDTLRLYCGGAVQGYWDTAAAAQRCEALPAPLHVPREHGALMQERFRHEAMVLQL